MSACAVAMLALQWLRLVSSSTLASSRGYSTMVLAPSHRLTDETSDTRALEYTLGASS